MCPKCGALILPRSRTEDGEPMCWRCGLVTYRHKALPLYYQKSGGQPGLPRWKGKEL